MAQANPEMALEFFKEAFLLDERYHTAREYYAAMLFETGADEEARILVTEGGQTLIKSLADNDYVISLLNTKEEYSILTQVFEERVSRADALPQAWASLAFLYYQNDEADKAVEALERAVEAVPSFATTATCISDNIKAGNSPEEGCI